MAYLLVYHGDLQFESQRRTERFDTEPEAVIRACALIAQGGVHDFSIEDDSGLTVMAEADIRNRCKQTRMP